MMIRVPMHTLLPTLRAGMLAMDQGRDARPALECVWLHADAKGVVRAIATDGTWMLMRRLRDAKATGAGRIAIPRDSIAAFSAPRDVVVTKRSTTVRTVTFAIRRSGAVDARWGSRVVPLEQPSDEPPPWFQACPKKMVGSMHHDATIDPDLYVRACRAFRILRGSGPCGVALRATGDDPLDPVAMVSGEVPDVLAIIMPLRGETPPKRLNDWRAPSGRKGS